VKYGRLEEDPLFIPGTRFTRGGGTIVVEELLLLLANGRGFDMMVLNNSSSKSKGVNTFQVRVQGQCSGNFGGQYELLLMKRAFIKSNPVEN